MRKFIEHYLEILEERQDAVTAYDARLRHGMVEFIAVYSKDDIRLTMKDGTEIKIVKFHFTQRLIDRS